MIHEDQIVKKFLNEKSTTNITNRVNELKKLSDFSDYEEINRGLILPEIKLEELKIYKDVTLEIAKLSIHLLVDFNYYSRFCFKGNYDILIFKERLTILGYKNVDGIWKYSNSTKPERSIVLENVFIHHMINELLKLNSKRNRDPDLCGDENRPISVDNNSITTSVNNESLNIDNEKDYQQPNNDKKQLTLREKKFEIKDNSAHPRESWICKRCTFVNDSNISNCETCFEAYGMITNEKLPTNNSSESENSQDHTICIIEKTISVPETIDECNFQNSFKSESNIENSSCENIEEIIDLKENEKIELNDTAVEYNGTDEITSSCVKCQQLIKKKKFSLCDDCLKTYLICPNEACTQVYGKKYEYCKKCYVFQKSDLKYGNYFKVHRLCKNKKKWQCGFCFRIISKKIEKCPKCGNTRESFKSK